MKNNQKITCLNYNTRKEKKIMTKNYQEIIEEIYDEVKRRCYAPTNAYGIGAWTHHIEIVYKLAI